MTIKRMRQELQLTPVQSEAIELALDDFTKYYQMLQAQMDEVRTDGKDRIQNVLNPDQKKKFEQMVSDLKDKQIRSFNMGLIWGQPACFPIFQFPQTPADICFSGLPPFFGANTLPSIDSASLTNSDDPTGRPV